MRRADVGQSRENLRIENRGAMIQARRQRTISQPATVSGYGLFGGADVTLRFLPAPENHGIVFQRTDCAGAPVIPALVEYAVPRERRTALCRDGVTVEMTEHVLAALAGLWIDNCLVQLNAPEPPACDGSSQSFVDVLLEAGICEQNAPRPSLVVEQEIRVEGEDGRSEVSARPLNQRRLAIGYHLDYGLRSPIRPQVFHIEITPTNFANEIAFARTFVLEREVEWLKAQGYGKRTTPKDLLVFGPNGVIDNTLHADNECVRHKILDCVGDFALAGCDLYGYFDAYRSGHCLNRRLIAELKKAQGASLARAA